MLHSWTDWNSFLCCTATRVDYWTRPLSYIICRDQCPALRPSLAPRSALERHELLRSPPAPPSSLPATLASHSWADPSFVQPQPWLHHKLATAALAHQNLLETGRVASAAGLDWRVHCHATDHTRVVDSAVTRHLCPSHVEMVRLLLWPWLLAQLPVCLVGFHLLAYGHELVLPAQTPLHRSTDSASDGGGGDVDDGGSARDVGGEVVLVVGGLGPFADCG